MIRTRESGNTLVELVFGLAICMVVLVGSGGALLSSMRSGRALEEDDAVFTRARSLIERLSEQPFGTAGDGIPTTLDVATLFSMTGGISSVTLSQLAHGITDGTWTFRYLDLPSSGAWAVTVDQDLDGDAAISGALETFGRVYRILVRYDGRDVIETRRAIEGD